MLCLKSTRLCSEFSEKCEITFCLVPPCCVKMSSGEVRSKAITELILIILTTSVLILKLFKNRADLYPEMKALINKCRMKEKDCIEKYIGKVNIGKDSYKCYGKNIKCALGKLKMQNCFLSCSQREPIKPYCSGPLGSLVAGEWTADKTNMIALISGCNCTHLLHLLLHGDDVELGSQHGDAGQPGMLVPRPVSVPSSTVPKGLDATIPDSDTPSKLLGTEDNVLEVIDGVILDLPDLQPAPVEPQGAPGNLSVGTKGTGRNAELCLVTVPAGREATKETSGACSGAYESRHYSRPDLVCIHAAFTIVLLWIQGGCGVCTSSRCSRCGRRYDTDINCCQPRKDEGISHSSSEPNTSRTPRPRRWPWSNEGI